MDIHLTESRPYYQVWTDGQIYDHFAIIDGGPPLTWSQQWDVVAGYREALES